MATSHFDVIIIGESLAARVAAVLLARTGRRVLLAGTSIGSSPPLWIPGTHHLLRLLEQLGEVSCLVSSPPLQVLSGETRLTFHGRSSLEEEFSREFPRDHFKALQFLGRLNQYGEALQTITWDCGGLPLTGFTSRRRFLWKSLLRGITRRKLARRLTKELQIGVAPQTGKALETLFGGLTLYPIEQITIAQASMIWNGVVQGRGVFSADLDRVLSRHFDQSGGELVPLASLKRIQVDGGKIREAIFANGRTCTADLFLLGDRKAAAHFPAALHPEEAFSFSIDSRDIRIISGEVSPLLARFALVECPFPIRLSLIAESPAKRYRADFHADRLVDDNPPPSFEDGVSKYFPFAALDITPGNTARRLRSGSEKAQFFPGQASTLIAGENLFYCCGDYVMPSIGPTGEILVGVTTFNHLQKRTGS